MDSKIKVVLDSSMKATSISPRNTSAWNISASVRSLRDGVQRSCEIVASQLLGYSHVAIEVVREGGGATLPMLSTFILGFCIVQWLATVKAQRRQDAKQLRKTSRRPCPMRRSEAGEAFEQKDRRQVSNKQSEGYKKAKGKCGDRKKCPCNACFLLMLVVGSSCISFVKAISDANGTPRGEPPRAAKRGNSPGGGARPTFGSPPPPPGEATGEHTSQHLADVTSSSVGAGAELGGRATAAGVGFVGATSGAEEKQRNGKGQHKLGRGATGMERSYIADDTLPEVASLASSEERESAPKPRPSGESSGYPKASRPVSLVAKRRLTTTEFCTFETGECSFSNPVSSYDWVRHSGGTPSGGADTGPSAAYQGSYYMYVEASSPNNPRVGPFVLQSDVNPINEVTFWYNMYGTAMGTLDFDTSSDNGRTWTTKWSRSGNQGSSWDEAIVPVPSTTTTIRFAGTTGSSYTSDMAIDDVSVQYATPTPSPTMTPAPTMTAMPTITAVPSALPIPVPTTFVPTLAPTPLPTITAVPTTLPSLVPTTSAPTPAPTPAPTSTPGPTMTFAPTPKPTVTPITNDDIGTAVSAWCSDPTAAAATYGDISGWDTSNVTDGFECLFGSTDALCAGKEFCSTLTTFNDDISSWNTSSATTMYQMFSGASAFNQDISAWDGK